MEQITEGLKEQFARNIALIAQQEGSRLRRYVGNETQEVEVIHFETMGTHKALPRHKTANGYHEPNHPDQLERLTEYKTPKITRRFAYASSYHWSAAIDRNDKINLLTDPTKGFSKMAGYAMGRLYDEVIIKAFASPVNSGASGQNIINFDVVNNVVPVGAKLVDTILALHANNLLGVNNAQTGDRAKEAMKAAGLTVEKLLKAHQILRKNSFGADEKYYLVCTAKQINDLLHDPQVTSYDYNSVRALNGGEVKSFLGFQFINSEMLGGIRGSTNSIRDCYAFTEDSIRFGSVTGSVIRKIEEIERYHYARGLYYSESFGATRTNERQIVCIKCLEPTNIVDHTGDVWKASVNDAGFNGAISASIVPWQMIGVQCKTVDNSRDILIDALEPLLSK